MKSFIAVSAIRRVLYLIWLPVFNKLSLMKSLSLIDRVLLAELKKN